MNIYRMKTKLVIFAFLTVFGFIIATLGIIALPLFYNIYWFWPAAVVAIVGAIFFGWTGIWAAVFFHLLSYFAKSPEAYTFMLCYIIPPFINAYMALFLYKKFGCSLSLKGFKEILKFSLAAAVIPPILSGLAASLILFSFGEVATIQEFFKMWILWFMADALLIILFGIPVVKAIGPILRDSGLLFGLPDVNRPTESKNTEQKNRFLWSNFPIFLKIFFSLLIGGMIPLYIVGTYEVITSDASSTIANITSFCISFGFFAALVLTGLLTRAIISPVKKLSLAIEKVQRGDFDHRIKLAGNDEMGKLADAFNKMSQTVKDNLAQREVYMQMIAEHEKLAAIGGITSTVAHDVRKPFTQLKAVLEMLPTIKGDQIEKCSKELDLSIRKVESMLSDIMEYSREAAYTLSPENVLAVLDLSIKDASCCYPEKKVNFYYDLETPNLVNLDEQRLSRAFDNIIGNAFEAVHDDNAFVWFVTKNYEDYVEIVIGNSGGHIPENQLDKVFNDKFTCKKSGTGLGLSIAKKIIEGHTGTVTAKNVDQAPDCVPDKFKTVQGVEFTITLPVSIKQGYELKDPLLANSQDAKTQHGMVDKKSRLAGSSEIDALVENLKDRDKKPTILILDDESVYRMRVQNVWDRLAEVKTFTMLCDASNYKEAVELMEHTHIDYLVCDIDLADKKKNGFDVLKFTKEKHPECRVMMHTNRREPEDIEMARKLGACGFCSKPITEAIFVDLLSDKELWPEEFEKGSSNTLQE